MIAGLAATEVSAHRRDEYLQAARLIVEPDRVELGLTMTPGIAVADAIIADIDRDRDGSLSGQEQQDYAARVVSAIDVEVDGRRLELQPGASIFPDLDAMRRGEGSILLRSGAAIPSLPAGTHHVFFRNRHRPDVSVYLANAVVPASERLAITAQHRDRDQRELAVDYVLRTGPASFRGVWLIVAIALAGLTAILLRKRSQPAH
jgi:hypothetical protein